MAKRKRRGSFGALPLIGIVTAPKLIALSVAGWALLRGRKASAAPVTDVEAAPQGSILKKAPPQWGRRDSPASSPSWYGRGSESDTWERASGNTGVARPGEPVQMQPVASSEATAPAAPPPTMQTQVQAAALPAPTMQTQVQAAALPSMQTQVQAGYIAPAPLTQVSTAYTAPTAYIAPTSILTSTSPLVSRTSTFLVR